MSKQHACCTPEPAAEITAGLTPELVRVLVDNHARFLGFLERPVGSRPGAYDNPGSLAYDRAVNDVLLLLDKSIVALGATYLPDIVFGGDRQPTRP